MVMTRLKQQFQRSAKDAQYAVYTPGLYGRGDGTINVPGGLGYVYVRIDGNAGNTIAWASNPHALTLVEDDPVWLDKDNSRRVFNWLIASKRNKS